MTGDAQIAAQQSSETPNAASFIAHAFEAWHAEGIPFLVLRNYESLPASTSNDIDVLVHPGQLRAAEEILRSAAGAAGFQLHNRGEFATLALYFSPRSSTAQVHFDLFTALKWRGFDFLDCSDFLARKVSHGPINVPHPAHEAATNLTAFLLFTGKVKDKYKQSVRDTFERYPDIVGELLARSYGPASASFLVESAIHQKWGEIEARVHLLRRALVIRQLARHPLRSVGSIAADGLRLGRRVLRRPGIMVVLCGPDGCGKSTAAAALGEALRPTFSPDKGAHLHWKPAVLSSRRMAARRPTTDPHALPPRSRPLSLLFFAFHWLEFFLGFYVRVLPKLFRGGMVLIDRYYYDFFVDQHRYRLQVPGWLVRLGYALLPKPDIAFLLDAPAEVLQSRKREVPMAETERQRQGFLRLAQELPGIETVAADRAPSEVALEIVVAALKASARRFSDPPS